MRSARPLLPVDGLRKLCPVGKQRIWQRSAAPSFLHAVDGVSFTIGRGETVGPVGESGCGKSTIVRLIARLLDASSGSIRFDGEEIGSVPARHFGLALQRAHIQVVFQDATDNLNSRFTAFRAIADLLLRLQRLPTPHCALASRRRRE
jgi:ABC-type oligopeptide transport system ATPase subunit